MYYGICLLSRSVLALAPKSARRGPALSNNDDIHTHSHTTTTNHNNDNNDNTNNNTCSL